MSVRWRVGASSGTAGLVLAAAAAGTMLGAVQVVELSAQRVVPGTVVTLRVATTASAVRGVSGALFMIPSGTFGDSPEALRCEQVGRAIEVGTIHWTAGTVDYEGVSYAGVTGEVTFTVPQVPVDAYRLAESIEATGTGCWIFTSIDVVAALPDTALRLMDTPSGAAKGFALGVGLLAVALMVGRPRSRQTVGR